MNLFDGVTTVKQGLTWNDGDPSDVQQTEQTTVVTDEPSTPMYSISREQYETLVAAREKAAADLDDLLGISDRVCNVFSNLNLKEGDYNQISEPINALREKVSKRLQGDIEIKHGGEERLKRVMGEIDSICNALAALRQNVLTETKVLTTANHASSEHATEMKAEFVRLADRHWNVQADYGAEVRRLEEAKAHSQFTPLSHTSIVTMVKLQYIKEAKEAEEKQKKTVEFEKAQQAKLSELQVRWEANRKRLSETTDSLNWLLYSLDTLETTKALPYSSTYYLGFTKTFVDPATTARPAHGSAYVTAPTEV